MTPAELRVARSLRDRTQAIVDITDAAGREHLDDEYGRIARVLVARLARKRPSPLARGEARVWAAGAIYALGQINFLFDRSQTPHLTADQLADALGVVKTTMADPRSGRAAGRVTPTAYRTTASLRSRSHGRCDRPR